jgi:hypothetical protein
MDKGKRIKDKNEKDKGEGITDKGGVLFFSSYPLSILLYPVVPFPHFPSTDVSLLSSKALLY